MEQKLVKIGNSIGVIIPQGLLKQIGLKQGSKVLIQSNPDEQTIVINTSDRPKKKHSVSPRFLEALDRVNRRYGEALKVLAEK